MSHAGRSSPRTVAVAVTVTVTEPEPGLPVPRVSQLP